MDQKGFIKHVFPGGNTTKGFVSFYDNILFQEDAKKIIILKGGPGVGKSSFMKKISERFCNLGYNLEHHHCSSDNNALDGIVITDLKIAILDGTAPHVVDPINPGAIDEILNLGEYWNEEGIRKNKDRIMSIHKEVGRLFKKAYNYLAAGAAIYEAWANTERLALNQSKLNLKSWELLESIFEKYPVKNQIGKDRHLFGTAITPNGLTEYLHTIIGTSKNVYIIKDSPGASAKQLMNRIHNEAVIKGFYVECYHSPIDVDKIEDILIPELDCAITVSNDYHKAKVLPTNVVDLTTCLEESIYRPLQAEIDRDKKLFDDLLQRAIASIQKAKKAHDELESYYIPSMDFEKINDVLENTVKKIMTFVE
ncbi:PRK06851 family protein [Defluviitalea saccharophila]|uniref:PRK06851 family protein n=1 Tax=Defluviitalea saccharophila TaxID=879970 RepID=A0ABZ2Y767_9FIRM|nr:ATPase [Candidatus Epulonipiscium sp.]HHY99506.1 ATPase [Tissierellia bacterium]